MISKASQVLNQAASLAIIVTDRRDGKPKQAVDISGNLNHAHTAYRNPALAGLSAEELAALDGITRKLLSAAVPDVPQNQLQSSVEIPATEPQSDSAA